MTPVLSPADRDLRRAQVGDRVLSAEDAEAYGEPQHRRYVICLRCWRTDCPCKEQL